MCLISKLRMQRNLNHSYWSSYEKVMIKTNFKEDYPKWWSNHHNRYIRKWNVEYLKSDTWSAFDFFGLV